MSAAFWQPLWSQLAAEHALIAPEFRGHGISERPTCAFTLEDLADDVAAVIETSGAGGVGVAVVGVSLGGMVAQILAVRHPTLVRALVLGHTACTFSPDARKAIEHRAQRAEQQDMEGLATETVTRWFTTAFARAHPEVVARFRSQLIANDHQVHAWTWRAIANLDVCHELPQLHVPTLVLAGSEDASTPPQVARHLAEHLRFAHYVEIADAGHMSPVEQPASVATLITEFLAASL